MGFEVCIGVIYQTRSKGAQDATGIADSIAIRGQPGNARMDIKDGVSGGKQSELEGASRTYRHPNPILCKLCAAEQRILGLSLCDPKQSALTKVNRDKKKAS